METQPSGMDSIEVRAGPSGVGAKFTGTQIFCAVLLVLLAAIVVYLLHEHDKKEEARATSAIETMRALKEAVDRQAEAQQAFIFVLSLPQPEREKLNLAKPRLLYEMEKYERHDRELRR
jgi:hypothetical protein